MTRKERGIDLTQRQKASLEQLALSKTMAIKYPHRARILLGLSARKTPQQLSNALCIERLTVRQWQKKWEEAQAQLAALEQIGDPHHYQRALLAILSDAPRSNTLIKFAPVKQMTQVTEVSKEAVKPD